MREIKFRLFTEDDGMTYNPIIGSDISSVDLNEKLNNVDGKLLQFTGLMDRNGVDIYEGDIVKAVNSKGGISTARVTFWHGHFMLVKDGSNKKWISLGHKRNKGTLEVVGNIHENKELLDNK